MSLPMGFLSSLKIFIFIFFNYHNNFQLYIAHSLITFVIKKKCIDIEIFKTNYDFE
jgi:hypothetical protein